jgi:predicted DNA-binding protein YlxM (UPF0122 family)
MRKQERLLELGAMTEMYRQGASLAEVAERFEITRQAVYARLKPTGVLRSKTEAKALIRERETARGMKKEPAIRAALEGGETSTDVANRLGVLPSVTRSIYDTFEPLEKREIRYKGSESVYTDDELLGCLMMVGDVHACTPGVTMYSRYREAWPELALPHAMTIVKRFGLWSEACTLAGLTPNSRPAPGTGLSTYTRADMDEALRLAGKCVNGLPSISDYKDFIEANSWKHPHRAGSRLPSPGTIMKEYDGWLNALKANFSVE